MADKNFAWLQFCSRAAPRASRGALVALAFTTGACQWSAFDKLQDEAPVRTYDAPGSYRSSNFGSVIASFQGKVGKKDGSRLFVSAGADSPIVMERVWDSEGLDSGSVVHCKEKSSCSKGASAGAVLIPFETWARGSNQEHHGCIYTPGAPNAYVFCEDYAGSNPTFKTGLTEASASLLVFGGAPLPPEHPLGLVLVGAHRVSTRTQEPSAGKVYFQPDLAGGNVPPLRMLEVLDPTTGAAFADATDAGDFGFSLATAETSDGELLIAISQPSQERVIVASFDEHLPVPDGVGGYAALNAKLRTRACIASPSSQVSGFGKRLALGDVNGDGKPELFAGIDPLDGHNDGKTGLWVLQGSDLPAVDDAQTSCPHWGSKPVAVTCKDGVQGVACKASAFGASLAIGDVDGDKVGDLLVGAPRADVKGKRDAGTVFIIPGSKAHQASAGLDFTRTTNLYASSFEAKGYVGTSVAAVHTEGRDEPAAGAPGSDTVYMFMCSSLEKGTSNKCLPK